MINLLVLFYVVERKKLVLRDLKRDCWEKDFVNKFKYY